MDAIDRVGLVRTTSRLAERPESVADRPRQMDRVRNLLNPARKLSWYLKPALRRGLPRRHRNLNHRRKNGYITPVWVARSQHAGIACRIDRDQPARLPLIE